ncbi:hypothetical protein IEO21_06560 [Rhodonia placenta]|uniref:Peptidase M14 domain-containing protein n=1 Tax=Rhodonia placenta TaxID=104341 RepID=A0A8H7U160_9APHY|nr:hypothetical protein IEO21_06560 [Postia placenta]
MRLLLGQAIYWTFFSVSAHARTLDVNRQTVLGAGTQGSLDADDGLLKSFSVLPDKGWGVDDILDEAGATGADVWRISQSHVDIYFPTLHDYLSSPFHDIDLPHNTSRVSRAALIPPSTSGRDTGPSSWNLTSLSNSTFHSVYHPLEEIEEFVEAMAILYPDIVQLVNIGHSAEGREMVAMRISKGSGGSLKQKAGFVVTGAQHAREWVATSTALYLTHALVAGASEPYAMSSLLDYYDFYVIPVPNPDGYVYTWEHNRLWYKNRQVIGPHEKCVGIDMNRFVHGHKWKAKARFPTVKANKPSTPTDPCTPWYPGHRAFEAPEVNNIANFITTLPALKAYIDFRSYGQILSTPWAYSCKKTPKDAEDQIEAAHGAARAIKLAHGTAFTTGTLCSMLYKAPGNVVDWMYAKAGIKYAYAVHLRDTGTYGFSLPPEWIRPVGEESAKMIQFLAEFIHTIPKCAWDHLIICAPALHVAYTRVQEIHCCHSCLLSDSLCACCIYLYHRCCCLFSTADDVLYYNSRCL